MNFENQIVIIKEIFHKKWGENILKSAEAIVMLEMLEFVKKSTLSLLEGKLIVNNKNSVIHSDIHENGR